MNERPARPEIEAILGVGKAGKSGRMWRFFKTILGLAILAGLAVGAWMWFAGGSTQTVRYTTAAATTGDLVVVVTATGSVEPTNLVDISSELSGTVRAVNVDYNSMVKKGDVLAELDKDKLQAEVQAARAQLLAAQAQVSNAAATVLESQKENERKAALATRKVASDYDVEKAKAAYDRAVAALSIARADVDVAQADLKLKEINLSKAEIISPIDGVVLSRAVDPGQTVASSLQAPTLFEIAEDLTEMEVEVDVDEADIGELHEGQLATFTVDAYPDRTFKGTVEMVRYGSEVVSNVVTYKTILATDNSDLLLRPGMTATADITVRDVKDALLVSNAALRFTPPAATEEDSRSLISRILPGPPMRRQSSRAEADGRAVWILEDGVPKAVPVEIGASDGSRTQIASGDLEAGDQVIVDSETVTR
jgi:HlyD family secretion protein